MCTDETTITVTKEEWEWLQAELNREAKYLAKLAKLMQEESIWE